MNPNSSQNMPGRCPFAAHAGELSRSGLGPASRMCRESVFDQEMNNPDLPVIHAEEGAKFAALARRAAPPELLAEFIQERSKDHLIVAELGAEFAWKAAQAILLITASSELEERGLNFKYKPSQSYQYFQFCTRDPDLMLACFYLSLALQVSVAELIQGVSGEQLKNDLVAFGSQFDATNLVTALPVAVCQSLCRLRGQSAGTEMVDNEVLHDALSSLRNTGQFAINGRRRLADGSLIHVALQCPMQGYLFELLCKHETLQPIIAGIKRISARFKETGSSATAAPAVDRRSLIHSANVEAVRSCADTALQCFQSS